MPLAFYAIFNALAAVCLALLGHPVVAAAAFAGYCAIDAVNQTPAPALAGDAGAADDAAKGFRRLAVLCALRVSGLPRRRPTALALAGGPAS